MGRKNSGWTVAQGMEMGSGDNTVLMGRLNQTRQRGLCTELPLPDGLNPIRYGILMDYGTCCSGQRF